MNPIYNEYITFLRDTTGEKLSNLKEGYFWLDRQIVKGFDKQGNVHKFYRVNISNDMKVSFLSKPKGYSNINEVVLSSWNELIEMNKEHLQKIETESLNLIKEKIEKYKEYTSLIPVSMGKDSMVTAHLVRSLYPDTKAIFNNTSLDCADTYLMVKDFPNCEIMNPEEGFYPWIKRVNWIPSRIRRGCCSIFKVGSMVNNLDKNKNILLLMGMRNEESSTRSNYEDEVINPEWGKTKWQGILPIRKWTELDIWLYTIWKNIDINPKYKKGYSRCGCHCACPYYTKTTWVLDRYFYPKAYERWRNILREYFINNKVWITFNCTIEEYETQAWNGGAFRDEPTQEVIEEFAKYNDLDTEIAHKYFNKYCSDCTYGKDKDGNPKPTRIKSKEVLAMNMKFHGRDTTKFLCKKCFKKLYSMDEERWNKQVETFKQDGCALFDKE